MVRSLFKLGLLSALASGSLLAAPDLKSVGETKYDFVVYGSTPGGIACAVRAAKEGLKVLFISPTEHIGGFMSSGCGGWEAPYDGTRSPLFDEVRRRISSYYAKTYGVNSPSYLASLPDAKGASRLGRPRVEPKVVEQVFNDLVAEEKNLTLVRGELITGATKEGDLIKSITLKNHASGEALTVSGAVFADGTYEGDLAAAAGVPFRIGREARSDYDESWAGVVFAKEKVAAPGEPPPVRLFPNLRNVGLARGLDMLVPESTGLGDASVMSYNFRLILTTNPANRVMVTKPEGYDPTKLGGGSRSIVKDLPNDKIAWNGGGRLVGPQSEYPGASYERREQISRDYLKAAVGRLWFYQNDPAAKPEDKEFWKDYGLAKDEFVDNAYLPYEIYVREGRRIIGQFVFTQHDSVLAEGIERSPIFPDSVAITDWPFDSVICTPAKARGASDGLFQVADIWRPGQVPYRTMLPKGVENLLVPVALSSSHVGFGTLRLEPVWMQTGEAAGYAVAQAKADGVAPTLIDTKKLIRKLSDVGFLLTFFGDIDPDVQSPWKDGEKSTPADVAAQRLGTLGYFNSYTAGLDAPLTEDVAKLWIATSVKLAGKEKDFDPLVEARKLPATPAPGTITGQAFVAGLKASLAPKSEAAAAALIEPGTATPITRGQACLLIEKALNAVPL